MDVEDKNYLEIAKMFGIEKPETYEANFKIPQLEALGRSGRTLLNKALSSEGGWRKRAEEMKAEIERYSSLSEEEKEVEQLAENLGWSVERAYSLFQEAPAVAQFLSGKGYRP